MKNLSKTSILLYELSLFNKLSTKESSCKPKILLSCPLIQKGFHKKNFLNFIYFIFLITGVKPKLRVAQDSNALLKIRKGALVESFSNILDLKVLFLNRIFLNFEKEIIKSSLNKNFFNKFTFSRKFKISINLNSSYYLYLLLGQSFHIYLIFNFNSKCKRTQKFVLSTF